MSSNKSEIVVTPEFRMVWPNLFEPRAFMRDGKPTGEPKYGLTMLFTKDDISGLKVVAAKVAKAQWPGRDLKELKFPFKNGDALAKASVEKDVAADKTPRDVSFYEGKVVVKTSSKFAPQVYGMDRKEVLDPKRAYSGAFGYAELNFVAYPGVGGGQDGVTCYVNFVMLSDRKGDRIAGRNVEDVFAGIQGSDVAADVGGDTLDDEIPF
ncbi:MAG: ssDNA-binding protein [Dehalococcoidia bacterium]